MNKTIPDNFFSIVNESTQIREPLQLFMWLQGDLQGVLPHEVLMAAYGDIGARRLHYKVVSSAGGACGGEGAHIDVEDLIVGLFKRWHRQGSSAYTLDTPAGIVLDGECRCSLHRKLRSMRSVMVQGMRDERAGLDVLYVLFRAGHRFGDESRHAFDILMPHIDCAFRRIAEAPAPQGMPLAGLAAVSDAGLRPGAAPLSGREHEIMHWVGKGKTNYEIGMILGISPFTVKNHLQRIFRKIDVSNRAQAVSMFGPGGGGRFRGNELAAAIDQAR